MSGMVNSMRSGWPGTNGCGFAGLWRYLPRNGAPTTWLIKVEARQGEYHGIVANEALCLSVLRRLGLPVVHAERSVIGGTRVLLVARYDRVIGPGRLISRRHQEDAAQVLGVPRGTVESRLFRARQELRDRLKAYLP